jgi:hypothetical protein
MQLCFESICMLWGGNKRGSSPIKAEWLLYVPPGLIIKAEFCLHIACVDNTWFTQLVIVTEVSCAETAVFKELGDKSRARLRGWPGGQLAQALRRNSNIVKYGASNLRFPHAIQFLRKLSAIWAHALKKVRHPCPRQKKIKDYWLEGAQNY